MIIRWFVLAHASLEVIIRTCTPLTPAIGHHPLYKMTNWLGMISIQVLAFSQITGSFCSDLWISFHRYTFLESVCVCESPRPVHYLNKTEDASHRLSPPPLSPCLRWTWCTPIWIQLGQLLWRIPGQQRKQRANWPDSTSLRIPVLRFREKDSIKSR